MKKILFSAITAVTILAAGCNNSSETKEENQTTKDSSAHDMSKMKSTEGYIGEMVAEDGNMMIHYFINSKEFADAKLEMNVPETKNGKVHFSYKVSNYTLAEQTPDAANTHCNNSKKGQHIHLILNNNPYKALYKTEFDTALKPGHYLALSFLSRSYHESIKNASAFQLAEFDLGLPASKAKKHDQKRPLLFYSRPKGEYIGEDAKTVLLDFYLVNTELSETGNKVKATINGKDFLLNRWTTYALINLPMGKNTIRLTLIDKDGKQLGEENSVERIIELKEK